MEIRQHALIVLLHNIFRDALHAKDFNVEAGTVGESIVDGRKLLFVDLAHVDAETTGRV